MSTSSLSPAQSHALFDILIHHQLYTEIEGFKYPEAIDRYGFPFRKDDGVQTTSPLLQSMLNKFALRLPAVKNLSSEFWQDRVRLLVKKMAEAELSESYDKGAIGARKALATAVSSLLEYVARGMLGGWPKGPDEKRKDKEYDTSKPEDILGAWDDAMREVVYGDLLEEAFKKTGETGNLEDHSSLIKGVHEYILLNLASFLHHVFVMSPDGQYILRLLENVHRLVPYYMVKQTLRVGNAATMINGMVKLVLTKISVTAVTNWFGLTNNSNDGMNLMQQILSTVMAWDTGDFQKKAQKLESFRDGPDKKVFKAIKTFVYDSREKHDAARQISVQESKSIVAIIIQSSDLSIEPDSLDEHQHSVAMEYYSTLLSIRDREELTKVLCKLQPDVLTAAMRDVVAAFDPIIRTIHSAVDLSGTVTDAESFLTDLIKISKPRKKGSGSQAGSQSNSRSTSPAPTGPASAASVTDPEALTQSGIPTVEDYVKLMRKHMPSSHKFIHQVCKNAPDLAKEYLVMAKACAAEFRVHDSKKTPEMKDGAAAAGNMTEPLQSLFSSLSEEKQKQLKELLDHHEKHLKQLKSQSHSRLKAIMISSRPSSSKDPSKPAPLTHQGKGTTHGPGMYLSRWHSLLDSTLITPATLTGPVRKGWEVKGELDGKGLKTDTLLNHVRQKRPGSSKGNVVSIADGTGDAQERRERKRDGKEEERTQEAWDLMGDGWIALTRALEVMGPD
ncbi:PX-associated-domain-containing protein [Lophiotrema nucula]|uniref:PX-associated-domain-containing protein n=1 Tax=Lophiotrema nucula TaxID=690887 RepID=A0A6A5ZK06_9PLEO|nr:PX-associated-domain-containing protein [Lophiotrema nucula]